MSRGGERGNKEKKKIPIKRRTTIRRGRERNVLRGMVSLGNANVTSRKREGKGVVRTASNRKKSLTQGQLSKS